MSEATDITFSDAGVLGRVTAASAGQPAMFTLEYLLRNGARAQVQVIVASGAATARIGDLARIRGELDGNGCIVVAERFGEFAVVLSAANPALPGLAEPSAPNQPPPVPTARPAVSPVAAPSAPAGRQFAAPARPTGPTSPFGRKPGALRGTMAASPAGPVAAAGPAIPSGPAPPAGIPERPAPAVRVPAAAQVPRADAGGRGGRPGAEAPDPVPPPPGSEAGHARRARGGMLASMPTGEEPPGEQDSEDNATAAATPSAIGGRRPAIGGDHYDDEIPW